MIKIEDNQESDKTPKYIFTDTYKTKDLIWEGYHGFIEHYSTYVMTKSLTDRIDPINLAGLTRYANHFYGETKDFYKDFEKQLTEETIKQVEKIMSEDRIETKDFSILRDFFSKFMKISGIKNIIRETDDIDESILEER